MAAIFSRPALAAQMTQQLLHPGVLGEGVRSGLFLSGLRRIGKTTFLIHDLAPALEAAGAVVIYVDLWSNAQASPAQLLHDAIRQKLADLRSPATRTLKKLASATGVKVEVPGLTLDFDLEKLGSTGGATLAHAFRQIVDQTKRDVVVLVDEVQHAMSTEEGNQALLALKAARDAINTRPRTPGHFIFVGTGSHRALINELTTRRTQAFAGALSVPFPPLGSDYVANLLERLREAGAKVVPSPEATDAAFATLGNRPEELRRALVEIQSPTTPPMPADAMLEIVAKTLRSAAADTELAKVEQLGALAGAVFERIAETDGNTRGVFSAEAARAYSRSIGRTVRIDELQPVVGELLAANLIMRRGHGLYAVCDPFVQDIWRERARASALGFEAVKLGDAALGGNRHGQPAAATQQPTPPRKGRRPR